MEILKLDIADLEYIKRTIEWMTEHMDLKDQNQDIEDLHNLTRNSLTALERGMEWLKIEAKSALPIDSVMVAKRTVCFGCLRALQVKDMDNVKCLECINGDEKQTAP